jgi:hypothetical protein
MGADGLGSLEWGEATRGLLTGAQRCRLQVAALGDGIIFFRSLLLLALRIRRGIGAADLSTLNAPATSLAKAVQEAAEAQAPQILGHTRRTIAFAHAIAALDKIRVDDELLWCACLLHDIGLERPETDHCFAVRGGLIARDIALEAGADAARAQQLGDTICRHATPRLDPKLFPLPYLVASGALVDILGRRLEQMDPGFVDELLGAEPRGDFPEVVADAWRREARAVVRGRAAIAEHLGFSRFARRTSLSSGQS